MRHGDSGGEEYDVSNITAPLTYIQDEVMRKFGLTAATGRLVGQHLANTFWLSVLVRLHREKEL